MVSIVMVVNGAIKLRTSVRTIPLARVYTGLLNKRNQQKGTPGCWVLETEFAQPYDNTEAMETLEPAIRNLLVLSHDLGISLVVTAAIKRTPEMGTQFYAGSTYDSERWPEQFTSICSLVRNASPNPFDKIFTVN